MNKKLLLALQKRNTERLDALKTKLGDEALTPEELAAIEAEIETLSAELDEVATAIADLDEESDGDGESDEQARGEVSGDQGEKGEGDEANAETDDAEKDDQTRGESAASAQARAAAMTAVKTALSTRNAVSTKKKDAQMRSAFANFVVGNISEAQARSLGIVTGQGSVTVPESIAAEIITYAQEENLLRKYGTAHKTKGNVKYPVLVKKAVANVTKTERAANMPETDIEFDEILLDPTEFDALATVSKKLVKMSGVNIEEIVVDELKKAYVEKETNYMFNGSDVGHVNPGSLAKRAVGYFESAAVAIDTAGWSQRLHSQLVKLKGQPVTEVLKKSMWIVNRAALTVLEDMTDANGRPLLHEAVDGIGYKFLGHKLDFTDAADGTDVTKPVFYFGDFSTFHIQDVIGNLEIQRLVEAYAAQNKIGFQIYNLLDGQLIYSPLAPSVYRYEVGATAPVGG